MQWLEMQNVEYGTCTVLCGKSRTIFMVDCGSVNHRLRGEERDMSRRFSEIAVRYHAMQQRHFLLTHYHRDHMNGFYQIVKSFPDYFDRIYLPAIPEDREGLSPLIDFALFAHVFLPMQTTCAQVNTSCLYAFQRLSRQTGIGRLSVLGQGDSFTFDGITYDVLWPPREKADFPDLFRSTVSDMNACLANPYLTGRERDFLAFKDEFCHMYTRCCRDLSPQHRAAPDVCERDIRRLDELLSLLDDFAKEMRRSPVAPDILALLTAPSARTSYSESTNAMSLVFHNRRTKQASFDDILMTGDCTPDTLARLSDALYSDYFIVQAPHHGTSSGYSPVLRDLGIFHLLLSGGDYPAAGKFAMEYLDFDCIRHCTNTAMCPFFAASSSCCNRVRYCYDRYPNPALSLRCEAAGYSRKNAGCGVYIIDPSGVRGCFCDAPVNRS